MSTIKYKNKKYDLAKMDKASLLELKSKIDFETNRLQTHITEVKTGAYKSGVYADPEWFKNATLAKSLLSKSSQKIQAEFSRRKTIRERDGANEQKTFLAIFNDICKHRLDKETYISIAKEAAEIARNTHSEKQEAPM